MPIVGLFEYFLYSSSQHIIEVKVIVSEGYKKVFRTIDVDLFPEEISGYYARLIEDELQDDKKHIYTLAALHYNNQQPRLLRREFSPNELFELKMVRAIFTFRRTEGAVNIVLIVLKDNTVLRCTKEDYEDAQLTGGIKVTAQEELEIIRILLENIPIPENLKKK